MAMSCGWLSCTLAAVTWMKNMQQKGNPKAVPAGDLQRTGKVATWPDGPWISTLYFDKTKASAADDIDVLPLPQKDPKMAGKVIGSIKKQFGDRADAQLTKKIAEELLSK